MIMNFLKSKSIFIHDDYSQTSSPICSHLSIRHRPFRFAYHIVSPHQAQTTLCKKKTFINNKLELFSISILKQR